MHLYRKCHGDHKIWNHLVTKCSFRHNLTEATKQKTYLTKVVKEYALMMEILCRPLNIESFGNKIFIFLQQFLSQERESCILACKIFYQLIKLALTHHGED